MNFFAHCVVAGWTTGDSAFALGSMLPDFATMSGGRLDGCEHDTLRTGVAYHHRTDAVFHSTPTFIDLCRRSAERLEREGVRWGTARAVAHVGIELFLDGWLLRHTPPGVPLQYRRALERGHPDDLGRCLRWRPTATQSRFEALRRRLLDYGLPDEIGEPEVVYARLDRVLEGRPRLRIKTHAAAAVRTELDRMCPELEDRADVLMEEVSQGLGPSVVTG